jgi:hypothetical protein
MFVYVVHLSAFNRTNSADRSTIIGIATQGDRKSWILFPQKNPQEGGNDSAVLQIAFLTEKEIEEK